MSRSIWLTALSLGLVLAACTDSSLTKTTRSGPEFPEPPGGVVDESGEQGITAPVGAELGRTSQTIDASMPAYRVALRFDEVPEAGQPAPYTVQVFQGTMELSDTFAYEVTVVPDVDVQITSSTITFNVPGTYHVTATAMRDDLVVEGGVDLTVGAGAPAALSVSTSPEVARAGDLVFFTLTAQDVAGNSVDPASAGLDMWIEPSGASVDPGTGELIVTEVGRYELHAETGTGVHAADIFHVTAAAPIFIDLQLDEYDDLEPGDTLGYEVYAEDTYGNVVESLDVAVTTEPAGGVVEARRIEWPEEGVYDVVAVVPGTPLEDREGPIVIDGYGPIVSIKSPDRGSIETSGPVSVRANVTDAASGVARVEINGQAVSLDRNGDFNYDISPALGVNLIEIDAWDVKGHHTSRVQSFMYGTSFYESGTKIPSSLLARVNNGTINMIEDWVEDEFDESYLRDLVLANSRIYGGCAPPFDWPCAYVDATSFSMSYLSTNLTPQSGYADLYAGIRSPRIGIRVTGTVGLTGNVTASWANLNGRLSLWVDTSGNIHASLSNISVNLTDFHIGLGIPDLIDFIEDWISDWVEDDVEDAIRDAIVDQVPPVIDDALTDLEMSTVVDVLGTDVAIEAVPQYISTTTSGITLYLGTIVEPEIVDPYMDGIGALRTWSPTPSYGSSPGFILSVSDDFLNQALYAMWESGSLNQLFMDYLMPGVDTSALSALVPGSSGLQFEIDPLLPPVFRPGTTGGGLGEFQVGDALIDIYATFPRAPRTLVARVAASIFARASVSIDASNTVLVSFVGTPEFAFDGLVSTIPNLRSEDLANLLAALIPVMIPELLEGVQEFPIPSFQGFTIGSPSVSLGGSYLDFMNVAGNLISQ